MVIQCFEKGLRFSEIFFVLKIKVLKTSKISIDCRIKTYRSLKRRAILKILNTVFQKNLCEHPRLLQVIHKWQITYDQTSVFLPFVVILDIKLSGREKGKYRGLSIGSTVCKLIINIILVRIRPQNEAQLSKEQNRFKRNRGTTDEENSSSFEP